MQKYLTNKSSKRLAFKTHKKTISSQYFYNKVVFFKYEKIMNAYAHNTSI